MWKKALAEVIGTFALVLIGPGAAVLGAGAGAAGALGVALAFGFVVTAMAYSVGTVSGAHLNPAVSLAMFLNKRLSGQGLLAYVAAQLSGAVAASWTLGFLLGEAGMDTSNVGANTLAAGLSVTGGFVIEMILTFFLVLVILTATGKHGDPHLAGIVIGFTLIALILMGITTSGASLNPARSFGPALIAGGKALDQLWLFTLGPLSGGVLAAYTAKYVLDTEAGAPGTEQEKAGRIA